MSYFVMLNHPNFPAIPMTTGDGDLVAFFDSLDDACHAGHDNVLGESYGFEVFCLGNGEI